MEVTTLQQSVYIGVIVGDKGIESLHSLLTASKTGSSSCGSMPAYTQQRPTHLPAAKGHLTEPPLADWCILVLFTRI